jgi:hypothetical protein
MSKNNPEDNPLKQGEALRAEINAYIDDNPTMCPMEFEDICRLRKQLDLILQNMEQATFNQIESILKQC